MDGSARPPRLVVRCHAKASTTFHIQKALRSVALSQLPFNNMTTEDIARVAAPQKLVSHMIRGVDECLFRLLGWFSRQTPCARDFRS